MKQATSTKAVVEAYIEAINAHDVASIVALSAPDHEFVDAFGGIVTAEKLAEAWAGYFAFMPRYGIEIDEIICDGDVASVFGQAWGGLNDAAKSWRRPAAWRARVKNGRVALWQVYVDTKVVFDLLAG
jgi:ketosteroid isomerase-like protein